MQAAIAGKKLTKSQKLSRIYNIIHRLLNFFLNEETCIYHRIHCRINLPQHNKLVFDTSKSRRSIIRIVYYLFTLDKA